MFGRCWFTHPVEDYRIAEEVSALKSGHKYDAIGYYDHNGTNERLFYFPSIPIIVVDDKEKLKSPLAN